MLTPPWVSRAQAEASVQSTANELAGAKAALAATAAEAQQEVAAKVEEVASLKEQLQQVRVRTPRVSRLMLASGRASDRCMRGMSCVGMHVRGEHNVLAPHPVTVHPEQACSPARRTPPA